VKALRAIAVRVRTGLRSVDGGLLALREGMTPGQRWTAVLAMTLTVLVLIFGLPRRVIVVPGAEGVAGAAASSQGAAAPPVGGPSPGLAGLEPAGPPSLQQTLAAVLPPAPGVPGGVSAPQGAASSFVALVRVGDRPEPGHDDASIAKTFLARAGIVATIVPLGAPTPDVCRVAAGAGNVVLAVVPLDPALRDCLVNAGATVLAFDSGGDRPPAGSGGQVLSTRRGVLDSLLDLGRWGSGSGALGGRVGLVVDDAMRDSVPAVVAGYRAAGLDVVATATVADDPASSTVSDGVRAFASQGVQVAVLAAPVAVQDRWVAAAAVIAPSLHHVVSDAFDGVINEDYPPSFDGSLAHTSLRVPWFARAHGSAPEQTACLQTWQATATPSTALSADEQESVFAWCEETSMTSTAIRQTGAFADAVRATTFASPLTSSVGPSPDGHWGPIQDAVLVWHASCLCWQEKQPFTERSRS
jgi:hypothetical protein